MKRIGLILLSLFLLCACQSGIEATLEDSVIVAMDDSNVSEEEITSSPEIDVVQIEAGKPFIFTALVALKPEVKLGKYK